MKKPIGKVLQLSFWKKNKEKTLFLNKEQVKVSNIEDLKFNLAS